MKQILLIEPDYRSKFPPLGLLKIAKYHKKRGDSVKFVRGMNTEIREQTWSRIYIATLFTWELPRAVKTVKYYSKCVSSQKEIFVGGVGATLLPQYIRENVECTLIEGQIDRPGVLHKNSPPIAEMIPDYSLLDEVEYNYTPKNAYFVRITKGCIRACKFCAVPRLETEFGFLNNVEAQIKATVKLYGERKNLVVLDNNILGVEDLGLHFEGIRHAGFERGAKFNGRRRYVDFNQGLDARLISENPNLAKVLSTVCISPIRLAFDFNSRLMNKAYVEAINHLAEQGFREFTNYMLFNFNDTPKDLWERMMVNVELNSKLGLQVTGFPMRFIPMDDVKRNHVSRFWKWRYLRSMQCILLATRGLVSPNLSFMQRAFGSSYEEFMEILAMPDRYIIFRKDYENDGALDWRKRFKKLSPTDREEFLNLLEQLNNDRDRANTIKSLRKYRKLIKHYYPDGRTAPQTPRQETMAQQGVSVGYD